MITLRPTWTATIACDHPGCDSVLTVTAEGSVDCNEMISAAGWQRNVAVEVVRQYAVARGDRGAMADRTETTFGDVCPEHVRKP